LVLCCCVSATAPAYADSSSGGATTAPSGGSSGIAPSGDASTTGTGATTPTPSPDPSATGGSAYGTAPGVPLNPAVPGWRAKIVNGYAYAPSYAPAAVQQAIWAANQIVGRPYVYGGGHEAFIASGYDCSGTVSYALHGGGLLHTPMDSSDFMRFGQAGNGNWMTIYTNPGHAYMVVAGIRLDTSKADDPRGKPGPRWRRMRHSNRGYSKRHPVGL
jgi:cell wall-associated NlpC family hydrolase